MVSCISPGYMWMVFIGNTYFIRSFKSYIFGLGGVAAYWMIKAKVPGKHYRETSVILCVHHHTFQFNPDNTFSSSSSSHLTQPLGQSESKRMKTRLVWRGPLTFWSCMGWSMVSRASAWRASSSAASARIWKGPNKTINDWHLLFRWNQTANGKDNVKFGSNGYRPWLGWRCEDSANKVSEPSMCEKVANEYYQPTGDEMI